MHEPTLAFDPAYGYFVLFYVKRADPGGTDWPENGVIYARTWRSDTGWGDPQNTGVYTTDAVNVGCQNGPISWCYMTYIRGNTDTPSFNRRLFWVDSNGTVSVGSSSQTQTYTGSPTGAPAVATRLVSNSFQWVIAMAYPEYAGDQENGGGEVYAQTAAFGTWDFTSVFGADQTIHTPGLASAVNISKMFLIYTSYDQ